MSEVRQNVIDKITKELKRSGFSPDTFEYDTETEELIEYDFELEWMQDYWWNGSTFQTTPVT